SSVGFVLSSRRRHTRFSRDWSSDVCSSDLTADLRLAYVELGDPENKTFGLRAGRQELVFGEMRLIGHLNWANTARSFDAVRGTRSEERRVGKEGRNVAGGGRRAHRRTGRAA